MKRRRVAGAERAVLVGGWLVVALTLTFLIAPVVLSILGSFAQAWHRQLFGDFTLDWYRYVFKHYSPMIELSLRIATCAVVLNVLIGVPAAYALLRLRSRVVAWFEETIMLPMAVPGVAVAIALIQTHAFMRGDWYLILAGHVMFTLPFMVKTVVATMRSTDLITLEEGASSLGANFRQRFMYVVVPNVAQAIVAGALMVFTISLGEFNLTLFLITPLNSTLPVGLYDTYASMRIEVGSAFTTIFFCLLMPILLLVQYLGARGQRIINV